MSSRKKALIILDVINELVHEDGSVGKEGYFDEASKKNIVDNIAKVADFFRGNNIPVYYVVVGFSDDYKEWSESSKLFRHVKSNKQAILGSWATQVHASVAPREGEAVIIKHRIDPFYKTSLEFLLNTADIDEVILTGVSSEFVVLSATISAHDRDKKVTVLEDCVSSSNEYSHNCAMHIISKLAEVSTSEQLLSTRCYNETNI